MNMISLILTVIFIICCFPSKTVSKIYLQKKVNEVVNETVYRKINVTGPSKVTYVTFDGVLKTGFVNGTKIVETDTCITVSENTKVFKDNKLDEEIGEVFPGGWLWDIQEYTEEKVVEGTIQKVLEKSKTLVKETVRVTLGIMLIAVDFLIRVKFKNPDEVENTDDVENTEEVIQTKERKVRRISFAKFISLIIMDKLSRSKLRYKSSLCLNKGKSFLKGVILFISKIISKIKTKKAKETIKVSEKISGEVTEEKILKNLAEKDIHKFQMSGIPESIKHYLKEMMQFKVKDCENIKRFFNEDEKFLKWEPNDKIESEIVSAAAVISGYKKFSKLVDKTNIEDLVEKSIKIIERFAKAHSLYY